MPFSSSASVCFFAYPAKMLDFTELSLTQFILNAMH